MKLSLNVLLIATGLTLAACGGSSPSNTPPKTTEALSNENQQNNGNWKSCDSSLINKYVGLEKNCTTKDQKRSSIKSCIEIFESLKDEYPADLHCLTGLDSSKYSSIISYTILESVRGKITREKYLSSTDEKVCGSFPTEDFYKIQNDCHITKLTTQDKRQTCINITNIALTDYPDLDCRIPLNEYRSIVFDKKWVLERNQQAQNEWNLHNQ